MALMLAISIFSIVFCYIVARARKANTTFWLLASLLLGPLAIPFVFFSKPKL